MMGKCGIEEENRGRENRGIKKNERNYLPL